MFVQLAQKFQSEITVGYNGLTVNAKSLLGILGLGVSSGARITIQAQGQDEVEAVGSLVQLVEKNFGEE